MTFPRTLVLNGQPYLLQSEADVYLLAWRERARVLRTPIELNAYAVALLEWGSQQPEDGAQHETGEAYRHGLLPALPRGQWKPLQGELQISGGQHV